TASRARPSRPDRRPSFPSRSDCRSWHARRERVEAVLRRLTLALIVAAIALLVPAAGRDPAGSTGATILFRSPAVAQAQGGPSRAGLVIRYSDGRTETRCVDFAEAQISGYELLRRG